MVPNKTKPEEVLPVDFLGTIPDEKRRAEAFALSMIMSEVTGQAAVMWGTSIVGFGTRHYKYESGREGDTPIVSFAPRKDSLALYGVAVHDQDGVLAARLGPHSMGKGCLYVKDLSAVDTDVLARMIAVAYSAKQAS